MESKEEDRPVEKYIAFVTNIKFDDPERIVSVIPEEYRYRWGIEKSYRVEDGFEAKTTSRNFTLRVIYFLLSIILYNFVVLFFNEFTQEVACFSQHWFERFCRSQKEFRA